MQTRRLAVVEPSDELEDALSLMREHQVRRLPVVEDDRLVGMLAEPAATRANAPRANADDLGGPTRPKRRMSHLDSSWLVIPRVRVRCTGGFIRIN